MSVGSGWILYVLAVVLVVMFWRRMRRRTIVDMIDADGREHHHVLTVLKKHPAGGRWRQFQAWMADHRE